MSLILERICRVNELRKWMKPEIQTQRVTPVPSLGTFSTGEKQICDMKVFFDVEKLTDVSESDERVVKEKQKSALAEY